MKNLETIIFHFNHFFSVFERCMVILKPSDIRQLLATSGKFVCTQAAVFSANMIGQKAYALYFGVKSLSQRSQILTASSMPGSLLIANRHLNCELEIRCLHCFQPVWHQRCFLSFTSWGKIILHLCLPSSSGTLLWKLHFCVFQFFSLHLCFLHNHTLLLNNSRTKS